MLFSLSDPEITTSKIIKKNYSHSMSKPNSWFPNVAGILIVIYGFETG